MRAGHGQDRRTGSDRSAQRHNLQHITPAGGQDHGDVVPQPAVRGEPGDWTGHER